VCSRCFHVCSTRLHPIAQVFEEVEEIIVIGIACSPEMVFPNSLQVEIEWGYLFQSELGMVVEFGDVFEWYRGKMGLNEFG
jgi:hypothetical protein